jgi:hypothetical protein
LRNNQLPEQQLYEYTRFAQQIKALFLISVDTFSANKCRVAHGMND